VPAGIVGEGGIVPRPDKIYSPGRLDIASTPSRGRSWSKYGGAGTASAHDGIATEITVDLTDDAEPGVEVREVPSKYVERSFAAPLSPLLDDPKVKSAKPTTTVTTEWISVRVVDGRTYRRRDERVTRTVPA
jgi:hypothetical protein